ncbi:MAG: peptide/nickel transport system ATP-binding protein [Chloroflexota bacterium]|nr:peptide/nickel transport system ATP-binding protein [Chloroflexota bacterium]
MPDSDIILSVRDLSTEFALRRGVLRAVDAISFDLARGEVVGLVGESGCGKSITARSVLRLIRKPGKSYGHVFFSPQGRPSVDLIELKPMGEEIRRIRGKYINMIFQEPMNALSPVHTIANQMSEAIMLHEQVSPQVARQRSIELLGRVGIPQPEQRIDSFSFQLSGGMRQRALIAMAISCNPELLFADEPTTALDVSVQAQILRLLKDLQAQYRMSMVFITHDLAVVAQMVDRVLVMYLGQIIEDAPVREIFAHPRHPYTRRLMASILDPAARRSAGSISAIRGAVPEPINLPARCCFFDRCDERDATRCPNDSGPALVDIGANHKVRCFREHDIALPERPRERR